MINLSTLAINIVEQTNTLSHDLTISFYAMSVSITVAFLVCYMVGKLHNKTLQHALYSATSTTRFKPYTYAGQNPTHKKMHTYKPIKIAFPNTAIKKSESQADQLLRMRLREALVWQQIRDGSFHESLAATEFDWLEGQRRKLTQAYA